MKSAFIVLTALATLSSAFADTAKLTTRNGTQTLSIDGYSRTSMGVPGVLHDLHPTLFKATEVLKVSRHPDVSLFEGEYIQGSRSCPAAFCTKQLVITQKKDDRVIPGRGVQSMAKLDDDTYEIRGEAAKEIYAALIDAGKIPDKSSSKTPSKRISGDSYICTMNPLGGMKYKCTLLINSTLR